MEKRAIYRAVARRMMSDLAVRRVQNGRILRRGRKRVELIAGEHRQIRLTGDTRCHSVGTDLRKTDFSWRATIAVTAEEEAYILDSGRERGANWHACVRVAQLALESSCSRLREHLLLGHRGRKRRSWEDEEPRPSVSRSSAQKTGVAETRDQRFAELDAQIARDAERLKQPKLPEPVRRMANVIRIQVRQYRSRSRFWRKEFEDQVGGYIFENRDADWYDDNLPIYRERLGLAEVEFDPDDRYLAALTLAFAELLTEGGSYRKERYDEAQHYFRLAINRWRGASNSVPDIHRQVAIDLASAKLAAISQLCRER